MNILRPINEQFNESYNEKGLQPSFGSVSPIRNVKVERRIDTPQDKSTDNNSTRVRQMTKKNTGYTTELTGKAINQAGKFTMQAGSNLSRTGAGAVAGIPLIAAGAAMRVGGKTAATIGKNRRKGRGLDDSLEGLEDLLEEMDGSTEGLEDLLGGIDDSPARKSAFRKLRRILKKIQVTRVNISILYWATPLYLTVQLPFAIMGIIAFTLAGTFSNLFTVKDGSSWYEKLFAEIGEKLFETLNRILGGAGLDLAQMSGNILMLFMGVVFATGLISLMAAFLIYTLNFISALSGEHAGLKMGLFLLAIIGYFIPLVNLFPWILLWMIAVWKYPK